MLCYISTKNVQCNLFKSLFTASVSIISEQPSYFYENSKLNDYLNVNKTFIYAKCQISKLECVLFIIK